jgi:hypothetical protein
MDIAEQLSRPFREYRPTKYRRNRKSSRSKTNYSHLETYQMASIHTGTNIGYANDQHDNFVETIFLQTRLENRLQTVAREIELNVLADQLIERLSQNMTVSSSAENSGFAFYANPHDPTIPHMFVDFSVRTWSTKVRLVGDPETVKYFATDLEQALPSNPCYIKWVYDPQHLDYLTVPVNHGNLPVKEMYPFLGDESLESFYDRYMASSANILVLIGLPGSGKTTFIRGLLAHTRKSATLAYHRKIIEQDSFFVQWVESDDTFMVLEDSDTLLLPREDGNDMMARFLNLGDGLISFGGKKMIFSTNLPNISDIDDALIRPGRCFDIVEFSTLNREQAEALAAKVGIDQLPDGDSFTISEIFASTKNEVKSSARRSKFGFV